VFGKILVKQRGIAYVFNYPIRRSRLKSRATVAVTADYSADSFATTKAQPTINDCRMIQRAAWQTFLNVGVCVTGMINLKWASGGTLSGLWSADIICVAVRLWAFVQS
jgi:hypothetical protein